MKQDTKLVTLGRDPHSNHGILNPPVYHASTVLFKTVDDLVNRYQRPGKNVAYGLHGTPSHFMLEDALAELEGGEDAKLEPSGLAAITIALMAFLEAGDHLLMPDSVYGPVRRFCLAELPRLKVETSFYDPMIGAGIADLIRPNTKIVYTESPGSQTFEVQDIPAIAEQAHRAGAVVLMDNAWATPLYFKPFEHGVDVSIQPVTKYIGGHSDCMFGAIISSGEHMEAVRRAHTNYGTGVGPDDVYLVLRGMRTMSIRLERHQKTGLILANWFKERPEVDRVLHPALPECPGHEFWKRDFLGASGLFGVVLKPARDRALAAMLDHMELFGMGFSWGGYESLLIPTNPAEIRTVCKWDAGCPSLRCHAGLEDPEDLIADLEAGFERFNKAR